MSPTDATRQPWERPTTGRMHVVHVSRPTSEGTAVVALGYVREQLARGWDVTVACPTDGWLGYAAREAGARVRWWESGREAHKGVLPEVKALRAILRERPVDVLHLHAAKAGLVGRLADRGRHLTFYQPHGWSFLAGEGRSSDLAVRWERFAARWTDSLVCVSDDEQELGARKGIDAHSVVLRNGIDLSQWSDAASRERSVARRELGLGDGPVAVCVGRLAPQKGQHDLLDAWPAVRERVVDASLVLVGDGPDREELARRSADLPGVRLVGARTDVHRWMAAANVVVVPSRWEGMALVPLEAMASARSVVATRAIGMAETVPAGAGAVVDQGHQDALVDALIHRLAHPRVADDEGEVGRDHVERSFDSADVAAELSRTYLRRLALRRRG